MKHISLDVAPSEGAQKWFCDSNTRHKVAEAFLWSLETWRSGGTSSWQIPLADYVQEQEAIGWDWFLNGWLAQSWQEYQEQVWRNACSCCSSKWWVAELIKKL